MHRAQIAADSTSSSPILMKPQNLKPRGVKGTATLHKHPVQVARRNERERRRVNHVNQGFVSLRQHIPTTMQRSKKLSKVDTLRAATQYIQHLQSMLGTSSSSGMKNFNSEAIGSFLESSAMRMNSDGIGSFLESSGYASSSNTPGMNAGGSEFESMSNEFDGLENEDDDEQNPISPSNSADWTANNIPAGYLQPLQHQTNPGPLSTPLWMNFGQSPATTQFYQQQHQIASQSFFNFLPELQFKHEANSQIPDSSSMFC